MKPSGLDVIEPDEYEVFNAALDEYEYAFVSLERTTISEEKLDDAAVAYLKQSDAQVDGYMADDFNKKNIGPSRLENKFSRNRYFTDEPYNDSAEIVKISRAGFDKGKNRAVIFIRYRLIGPQEAFYEEDNFVFLEKKDGKWVVIKKVTASHTCPR